MDGDSARPRVQAWRDAFDQSFVRAPVDDAATLHDYLAIQAGGGRYALRLGEVAGLQALRILTPCPSRHPELLGLSSFRGTVLPVYDLRVLLGTGTPRQRPAWWIAARAGPLGLAFDVFERHLRLPADAIAQAGVADARLLAQEALRDGEQLRPVVSIPSILERIREIVDRP